MISGKLKTVCVTDNMGHKLKWWVTGDKKSGSVAAFLQMSHFKERCLCCSFLIYKFIIIYDGDRVVTLIFIFCHILKYLNEDYIILNQGNEVLPRHFAETAVELMTSAMKQGSFYLEEDICL